MMRPFLKLARGRFDKLTPEQRDVIHRVAVTLFLNFILAVVFRPRGRDYAISDVAIDGAIFAVITITIDVAIIFRILKKRWVSIPAPPMQPAPPFVRVLPRGPVAMILALSIPFAPLCSAIGFATFSLFGLQTWTFPRFLVYKLTLAVTMNEVFVRLIVRRWLMADCFVASDGETAT